MRRYRWFFFLVAYCVFGVSLPAILEASNSSFGIFTNPQPVTSYNYGVGSNSFSWGNPSDFRGNSSSFTFEPNQNIDLGLATPILLGDFTYHNSPTYLGSEATNIDFEISVVSNELPTSVLYKYVGNFTIVTTPNNGDPSSSGDYIAFPKQFLKIPIIGVNQNIQLEIIGFGTLDSSQSVSIIENLKIEEYQSFRTQLFARVIVPTNSSQIIGLGDSIAAGYGLADEDRNKYSYPLQIQSLWGSKKGYFVKNLAISGAISGNCDEHCDIECQFDFDSDCKDKCMNGSIEPYKEPCHSVLENQIDAVFNTKLKIVTLSIGANDINFVGCMESWFKKDMTSNSPMDNECWASNQKFKDRLTLFRQNLDEIFRLLSYTDAQVFVTTPYDPFPKQDTKLCRPFYNPIAADAIYLKNYKIGSVPEVKEMATQFQNSTSSFVTSVIAKLNQTIIEVAVLYPNVHVVQLNFKGHDFCKSSSSAWVYGPRVDAWYYSLSSKPFPKLNEYKKALPSECEFPGVQEINPIVSKGNFFVGLEYYVNCMPHPTPKGQIAIAKAVIKSIKAQKIF